MKKICTYFFIAACAIGISHKISAQQRDTLPGIKLFSKKPLDITSSAVAVQQLNKTALSTLNSASVADAVKYFSGVVVKDYGGIGGLKTVSVRSLGANQTGVMYDGIILGDAQGGQIDLGRFSLDNIELIQLFNSQPADVLLPARTYASASVLALSSSATTNEDPLETGISFKLKAGSFGYINPAVSYKSHISKHFKHGINAEYQSANGEYAFIDYETGSGKSMRKNADIKASRIEYDATVNVNDSNKFIFKTYYYNSKRGLPGSVILYNPFSSERLDNESFFSQLSWQKRISARSRILICSKYSADYKYYLDPSYQNNIGKLENEFHQKEFYFSAAYSYIITPGISVSYASDYFKNKLKRTDQFALTFANPKRTNYLNNIAAQWKGKRFEINGNLLGTYITEKVEYGPTADDLHAITPAFSASVQPFNESPLRLRASYKNIFRAPTFDDLYFTNIGNTNLRPEYARQYNFGLTYSCQTQNFVEEIIFTTDAYYNKVKDKIIAVPRQNLFQWSMLNIGTAEIKGVDMATHINFKQWQGLDISAHLSYTFQKALDMSNPASTLYKAQLPYTPVHSGSVILNVNYNRISFAYNILLSSYRYRLGDPVPENLVQGWATQDVSMSYYIISKKAMKYKFLIELNNVFNRQYEIIKFYPMPRFNYRIGIIAELKK